MANQSQIQLPTQGWAHVHVYTVKSTTHKHEFYGSLDFVRDYPGEPVAER